MLGDRERDREIIGNLHTLPPSCPADLSSYVRVLEFFWELFLQSLAHACFVLLMLLHDSNRATGMIGFTLHFVCAGAPLLSHAVVVVESPLAAQHSSRL